MTKIKICGIKTIEASKIAANEGADYIGLVFVDGVRRKISINKAIEISNYINSLRVAPKIVGLFQNQHLNYVLDIIKNINLDCVQLCGNENEDFMKGAYLGPEYSNDTISKYLNKKGYRYTLLKDDEIPEKIADLCLGICISANDICIAFTIPKSPQPGHQSLCASVLKSFILSPIS